MLVGEEEVIHDYKDTLISSSVSNFLYHLTHVPRENLGDSWSGLEGLR